MQPGCKMSTKKLINFVLTLNIIHGKLLTAQTNLNIDDIVLHSSKCIENQTILI